MLLNSTSYSSVAAITFQNSTLHLIFCSKRLFFKFLSQTAPLLRVHFCINFVCSFRFFFFPLLLCYKESRDIFVLMLSCHFYTIQLKLKQGILCEGKCETRKYESKFRGRKSQESYNSRSTQKQFQTSIIQKRIGDFPQELKRKECFAEGEVHFINALILIC